MKYGIKSILRAPVKTALFLALLLAVSLFVSLGIGIRTAARGMLTELDSAFLTAGEIVFQGGYYPDADLYDETLARARAEFDLSAVAALPQVVYSEESLLHRVYVDGVDLIGPERPFGDYVILRVEVTKVPEPRQEGDSLWDPTSVGGYAGRVGEQLYQVNITSIVYSGRQMYRGAAYLFLPEDSGLLLERNHTYLLSGNTFTITNVRTVGILAAPPDDVALASGWTGGASFPYILDITDAEDPNSAFWEGAAADYYTRVIDMMTALNLSFDLVASKRVEAAEAFQRGEARLIDGTYFTPEDYQTGNACLISKDLATAAGVEAGDTISLNIHRATGQTGLYTSYWPEVGFAHTGEYRVAGVYQSADVAAPVYLPDAGQDFLTQSDNDFTFGRVVVKNGTAVAFMDAVRPLLPPQTALNLYDQGYEAAARAPRAVGEMADVILWVGLACALVVLFFFGYLFVYRNAASARILLQLGAGGRRVWSYLLSGVGVIAAAAATLGAGIGYAAARWLAALMYAYAREADTLDRRFSAGGFGELSGELSASLETNVWAFVAVAAGVMLVTLIICSLFARQGIRQEDPRLRHLHRLRRAKRQEGTSRTPRAAAGWVNGLPTLPLRYAVRAVTRGGARFLTVTVSFALLLSFICVLRGMGGEYRRKLNSVYDDVPVSLHFTDVRGRRVDNLAVASRTFDELAESEFVAESWYSTALYYHVGGVIPPDYVVSPPEGYDPEYLSMFEVDFAALGMESIRLPTESTFAMETFFGQLKRRFDPLLVMQNPTHAPEFFYTGTPEFRWAEGYDMDRYRTERGLIVSTAFLDRYGAQVGDRIALQALGHINYGYGSYNYFDIWSFDIPIVAAFEGYNATIYLPYFDAALLDGFDLNGEWQWAWKPWYGNDNYNSAGAMLRHTDRLSEFKDWLAERYDPLNRHGLHRRWVLIDDVPLYRTIETLNRYILYTDILFPALLAVAVGIGFLISNLLLRSRRREMALLRSLGQRRGGIFLALFWEQLWSCVPGILLGVGGAAALLGGAEGIAWGAVGLFAICYLAGAAAAIVQAGRLRVLEHLTEKEG